MGIIHQFTIIFFLEALRLADVISFSIRLVQAIETWLSFNLGEIILYYRAKSLCIYLFVGPTFSPSSVLLANRLTQALKIRFDYSVNFSWSSKHIFNFLCFVIQKLRIF